MFLVLPASVLDFSTKAERPKSFLTINQIKEGRLVLVTHQAGLETQNITTPQITNNIQIYESLLSV